MRSSQSERTQVEGLDTRHTQSWFSLRGAVIVLIPIVAAQLLLIRSLTQERDEYILKIDQLSTQLQIAQALEHDPAPQTNIQHSSNENVPTVPALPAIPSKVLMKIGHLTMLHKVINIGGKF